MVGDDPWKVFYLFYDPMQNLYDRDLGRIPRLGAEEVLLEKNCRNTRAICEEMGKVCGTALSIPSDTPAGREVVYIDVRDEAEAASAVGEIIRRLADEERLLDLHEKLIVLGSHRYRHTRFHAFPRIKGCQYSIADGIDGHRRTVPYLTSMKFKGCERPIVILYDFDESDSNWTIPGNLYTAMSRATHLLYVVRRVRP